MKRMNMKLYAVMKGMDLNGQFIEVDTKYLFIDAVNLITDNGLLHGNFINIHRFEVINETPNNVYLYVIKHITEKTGNIPTYEELRQWRVLLGLEKPHYSLFERGYNMYGELIQGKIVALVRNRFDETLIHRTRIFPKSFTLQQKLDMYNNEIELTKFYYSNDIVPSVGYISIIDEKTGEIYKDTVLKL